MKQVRLGYTLVVLLAICIATFSLVRYGALLKEKLRLENLLTQTRSELEKERAEVIAKQEALQRTIEEKKSIESDLEALKTKLSSTKQELEKTKGELNSLNEKISLLEKDKLAFKEELSSLREAKLLLESKVDILGREKAALEAKLHSLTELKKAIREVKGEIFQTKVKAQKELDAKKLVEGNRGYVIKGGQPTISSHVKIEVLPADL